MKPSELTSAVIAAHVRLIEEDLNEAEVLHLEAIHRAAVGYVVGQTGLTEEEIDAHEDLTVAILTLISDMYDQRLMTVDKANINRTADTIIHQHSITWIPEERDALS